MTEETDFGWRVFGAAVEGSSHQKLGLPCQDALSYRVLPDGTLILALADGAGTAERSDQGAKCAVESALSSLLTGVDPAFPETSANLEELMRTAFEQARQALLDLANQETESLRAYATTLTCAAVVNGRLVVGQIGDGAVVVMDPAERLVSAVAARRGEFANETYFLTQEDGLEQVEIQVLEGKWTALAAMTDGLTRLAFSIPTYQPHLPFFRPLFAFAATTENEIEAAEQLAIFLASERICARTDDDKALLLAVRSNPDSQ